MWHDLRIDEIFFNQQTGCSGSKGAVKNQEWRDFCHDQNHPNSPMCSHFFADKWFATVAQPGVLTNLPRNSLAALQNLGNPPSRPWILELTGFIFGISPFLVDRRDGNDAKLMGLNHNLNEDPKVINLCTFDLCDSQSIFQTQMGRLGVNSHDQWSFVMISCD